MDEQHRPPAVRECPRCHGVATLHEQTWLHWCQKCGCVQQIELEMEAAEDLYRSPAYDIDEKTQRRWWGWLTTWGPRIVAAVTGRDRP